MDNGGGGAVTELFLEAVDEVEDVLALDSTRCLKASGGALAASTGEGILDSGTLRLNAAGGALAAIAEETGLALTGQAGGTKPWLTEDDGVRTAG